MRSLILGGASAPLLLRNRQKEIDRFLKALESVPITAWGKAVDVVQEKYLAGILKQIYYNVGKEASKIALERFMQKKEEVWEQALNRWLVKNAGEKIRLIEGSLKMWLRNQLSELISSRGIEDTTQDLLNRLREKYESVAEWQVRRIVQTESMTAMSVASDVSVRALNVKFDKVWVSSGLSNTRLSHIEADGQRVDQDEPFIVEGEMLMYPHDSSMGATAGNIINCACSCIYLPKQ